MQIYIRIITVVSLSMYFFSFGGCREKKSMDTEPNSRPVTVLELQNINPVKGLQLTGSVMPWKEQDISFEVSGRLEKIVEMGTLLEGRWEEGGKVHVQGDVLALIAERPYRIRLKAAIAERDRAQAEYVRKKMAWEKKAIAEIDFIRATADRDSSQASFEQAEYDLDKCTLYAPFSGEVSEVYIEAGGYVQVGQPVAHLVMMDPIKIDLAVSSETARKLKIRETVNLFLPDDTKPTYGIVYEKSTVADPQTRTFRISIITRNRHSIGDFPPDDPILQYPRISDYLYLQQRRTGDANSPFFVEENRALRKDDDGYYVWAAPEMKIGKRINTERPVITLRKSRVTPGENRFNLQGIFLVRELIDIGELTPGSLIALDVPDTFQDGEQVLLARKEWQLQPGQIIPVYLDEALPSPGLYIPMNTIKPIDDTYGEIFIAKDGKAQKVKVKILGNVGELFQIEAADQNTSHFVMEGAQLITEHIHFIQDGEPVKVIKMVELTL